MIAAKAQEITTIALLGLVVAAVWTAIRVLPLRVPPLLIIGLGACCSAIGLSLLLRQIAPESLVFVSLFSGLGELLAIPSLIGGNVLNGWAERIKVEMDHAALRITNIASGRRITEPPRAATGAGMSTEMSPAE